MKFTTAWADVAAKNVSLKFAVMFLSLCTLTLTVALVKSALKEPIVIERSCFSKSIATSSAQHTAQEIDAFIKEAISQRFDTEGTQTNFLSTEESDFRKQEQKDLRSRNIRQTILVTSVKAEGNTVQIDSDRIVGVGQVRSVLAFPMVATISSTQRSHANPYGLILARVSQAKPEEKK